MRFIASLSFLILTACGQPEMQTVYPQLGESFNDCKGLTGQYVDGSYSLTIKPASGASNVFCVIRSSRCAQKYTFDASEPNTGTIAVGVESTGINRPDYVAPECAHSSALYTSCQVERSGSQLTINCGNAPAVYELVSEQ